QVLIPVVVIVAHRAADAVRLLPTDDARDARAPRDIRESAVVVVAVEPVTEAVGLRTDLAAGEPRALCQEQIQPAVAIHIDQPTAAPDHLRVIVGPMVSIVMHEAQPGLPGAVNELWNR